MLDVLNDSPFEHLQVTHLFKASLYTDLQWLLLDTSDFTRDLVPSLTTDINVDGSVFDKLVVLEGVLGLISDKAVKHLVKPEPGGTQVNLLVLFGLLLVWVVSHQNTLDSDAEVVGLISSEVGVVVEAITLGPRSELEALEFFDV